MELLGLQTSPAECQATAFTSSAYKYYRQNWSAEKNSTVYGSLASEEGMGCNFQIDGKLCSQTLSDEAMGDWSRKVKEVSLLIDHKFLNHDVPQFRDLVPTLERVAIFLFENLASRASGETKLRIWEGPNRWVEYDGANLFYGESCRISCVHKHWNPELTPEENRQMYGKCSGLHGHEYRVEVTLTGAMDEEAGWLFSRDQMRRTLKEKIEQPFAGAFLNDHLGNTSGEKIALQFHEILKDQFLTQKLYRLGLFETRKNSFFVGAAPF